MSRILVLLISFYQRFVSPYKGFRCASGVYYGDGTCSGIVRNIVASRGLFAGRKEILSQFKRCRHASTILSQESPSEDEGDDDSENDDESKEKKKKCGDWAFLPAACVVPDPSDCALGGAAEGAGGACSGVADAAAGACSCV